ncbi:MAG: DUF58 domain-containing protein [Planctomycetota bacterium]
MALLCASLALGLGALGLEPAWLVLAVLTPMLVLAPLLARAEARGIAVRAPSSLTIQAGLPSRVDLSCEGRGRDLLLRIAPVDRLDYARRLSLPQLSGVALIQLDVRIDRRGRYDSLQFEAASSFPFSMCEARATQRVGCDIVVVPRPLRRGLWLADAMGAALSERHGTSDDASGEFHALVDWRPGEPYRRLHAAASLRRGRPMRVEARSGAQRATRIVLLTAAGGTDAAFERAVSAAATLALELTRAGRRVELVLDPGEATETQGHVGLRPALRALATVARADPARAASASDGASPRGLRSGGLRSICVRTLSAQDDPQSLRDAYAGRFGSLVLCDGNQAPMVFDTGGRPRSQTRTRAALRTTLARASTGGQP